MAGGVIIVSIVALELSVITAPRPVVFPRLTGWREGAPADAA